MNIEEEDEETEDARVNILDLPNCILVEIITRLPVKSIFACGCVCKKFSKLLSDSYFHNAHQMKQPLAIILFSWIRHPYLLEIGDQRDQNWTPIIANMPRNEGLFNFLESCNGLICVAKGDDVAYTTIQICNPLLGEYITLPKLRNSGTSATYGFGFDPSSNRYKVVRIVSDSHPLHKSKSKTVSEIFTVGVDANWRTLKHAACPDLLEFQGHMFQGAIHGISCMDYDNIYALDIGEEHLRSISTPIDMMRKGRAQDDRCAFSLLELRNCLSIFHFMDPDELNIWSMREYGIVESWTKEYSIRENQLSSDNISVVLPNPIKIGGDGEIFILCWDTGLNSYNLQDRKYTEIKIDGGTGWVFPFGYAYFPTLISLKNLFPGGQVLALSVRQQQRCSLKT